MPTGDLRASHLRARELGLLGSTFTITGRRARMGRHRMSSISHLELVKKRTTPHFQMCLPEFSDWPFSPFHVSQGSFTRRPESRCLFQRAKKWRPSTYPSDFEMLHAKWPAAVSIFCYEIVFLNHQEKICHSSYFPIVCPWVLNDQDITRVEV